MMVTPGIRVAAAAACLLLPLWLGSCSAPARTAGPAASGGTPAAAAGVPEPQPQPAAAPETPPGQYTPPASAARTPSPAAGSAAPQVAAKGAETAGPASRNGALGNAAEVQGSPQAAPNGLALPGQPNPDASAGKPVYFVSVDDGGTTGVRFGCNDSLVAVYHPAPPQDEPLQTSLRTLLGEDSPAGLYNALEDSTLQYVSACYFDGTTVVVNLTGSINPGGECDIREVEAQLTHTAIAAVGAARAEIYVDGRSLADVLSLR